MLKCWNVELSAYYPQMLKCWNVEILNLNKKMLLNVIIWFQHFNISTFEGNSSFQHFNIFNISTFQRWRSQNISSAPPPYPNLWTSYAGFRISWSIHEQKSCSLNHGLFGDARITVSTKKDRPTGVCPSAILVMATNHGTKSDFLHGSSDLPGVKDRMVRQPSWEFLPAKTIFFPRRIQSRPRKL